MMREKVQMWFSAVPDEDKTIIRQKESLEKTMQEIVLLSKESTCLDEATRSNIEASFSRLQKMDLETYKKQSKAYTLLLYRYRRRRPESRAARHGPYPRRTHCRHHSHLHWPSGWCRCHHRNPGNSADHRDPYHRPTGEDCR